MATERYTDRNKKLSYENVLLSGERWRFSLHDNGDDLKRVHLNCIHINNNGVKMLRDILWSGDHCGLLFNDDVLPCIDYRLRAICEKHKPMLYVEC